MLSNSRFKEIYIACGYTDLQYGIDGLAASVRERFNLSPFEKDVIFLFCSTKELKAEDSSGLATQKSLWI